MNTSERPPHLPEPRPETYALHGDTIEDPFVWLEDGENPDVVAWEDSERARFFAAIDETPQRTWLTARFQHLWRYDDESTPEPCLDSDGVWFSTKKADQDKWVLHFRDAPDGADRVILDPNTWDTTKTLAGSYPSRNCRHLTYGVANAGDENPILTVLDLTTGEHLPDAMRGWRQGDVTWLPDGTGFYYTARPKQGEVPDGEEHYWHRVYFHRLGTDGSKDEVVWKSDDVKELYHWVHISEDGRWMLQGRSRFNKDDLYLKDLSSPDAPLVPLVEGLTDEHGGDVVDGKLLVQTDWNAPRRRLMVADVANPRREQWRELVPEHEEDVLTGFSAIGGHLYLNYAHRAATRIAVYTLDGTHLRDITLPTLGSAGVWGFWSRPTVWLSFSSYHFPPTVYRYYVKEDQLELYKKSPIDIDPSGIVAEQVSYPSKDGTNVTMFLVHQKGMPVDGTTPFLLYGYGGFNISMSPGFSTSWAVWIEAGGAVAIANLRGGGEYGKEWHEAGMREKKQNVFDDFLAAADWLVASGYTTPDRLAIKGGSNGGLLVSAALTQRPELFRAVLCEVPLTDMLRYHRFGLANIWSEEYGSSEDAAMYPHLRAYSPYANVRSGANYPAVLVTGSKNDARTDPLHARKLAAALMTADADHGLDAPIHLYIQGESGHGGGVTIDMRVDQAARTLGFLMAELGMEPPAPTTAGDASTTSSP